jgi:crotonobetainyl-CoA:carnitine CoA-transferase CaiB-like acyl-CoA transferase
VLDGNEVKYSQLFEAREHPQAGSLTMMKRVARIDGSRGPDQLLPALLGEHNNAVLNELGYSQKEIDRLRDNGAFGQQPDK